MIPSLAWPELPFDAWKDTYATLHRWLQIVGKVRTTLSPWANHSWNATLYPTASGLTTSLIPFRESEFQIDLDFTQHELSVRSSDGQARTLPLRPQSVAEFYRLLMAVLAELGIDVRIHMWPNEIADAVRFDEDEAHRAYDPEFANRFWQVVIQAHRVFSAFRAGFIGKCSPVHFFWGSADLAVTRFSGRPAPPHPGGIPHLPDWVTREAYSQEVSSAGFWAGGDTLPYPIFYSYAYPAPAGFEKARVGPDDAFYNSDFGEFILPYEAVRRANSPDEVLMEFLESTYDAAANLGKWDRHALERDRDPRHEARRLGGSSE